MTGRPMKLLGRSSSGRETRLRRVLAGTLVLAHVAGCAALTPIPEVTEEQRARLGVVGVVSVAFPPEDPFANALRSPAAGAALGVGTGVLLGPLALASAGGGSGAAAFILLLPVALVGGAIAGGIAGAKAAVPEETAGRIDAQRGAVLADSPPQETLRYAVLEAAAQGKVVAVRVLTVAGPAAPGDLADYAGLRGSGIDTVLEVGVLTLGFAGSGGADPELVLLVQTRARLIDAATNAVFYHHPDLRHVSAARKFSEWDAENALLLRIELQRACARLAERIVDQVFLEMRAH